MLKVKELQVKIDTKEILHGVDLSVNDGKVVALMGQNGSGKSTLANVLMGNPTYEVTAGSVTFNDEDLLSMDPTDRALKGVFLSFQYPSEIPGVNVASYLRMLYNKSHNQTLSPIKFREILKEKMSVLDMKEDFMHRSLNEGFSGGEKKRMEMLQLLVLEPKLAILDEVDSGLDVDAIKIVSNAVNYLRKLNGCSILIITHYSRILKNIEPDSVYVMHDGKIVDEGDKELAHKLEEQGYETADKI